MSEVKETITIQIPKAFTFGNFSPEDFDRFLSLFDWSLKDKKVVFGHELSINHLAFQIGITPGDERGFDERSSHGCKAKGFELIALLPGNVSAGHDLFCQFHRRHVDHAFTGRSQNFKRVVLVADDTAHERRHKLHHRVPRHRHDI